MKICQHVSLYMKKLCEKIHIKHLLLFKICGREICARLIYNVSETLILCHQLAKFGDHRHCVSTAMLVSVCHVILRDRVTEGSSNVMGRSPSKWVAFLLSLMAIDTVSWDIMVLVCNVISQDHLLKRSCDFMGRTPSRYVTILQGLVAIGTVVVELYCF